MFEITDGDIAALGDADLRTLVGFLCEAELRRRGLPASAVTSASRLPDGDPTARGLMSPRVATGVTSPMTTPAFGRAAFRGLLGVHSRCGLHTRAVTNS